MSESPNGRTTSSSRLSDLTESERHQLLASTRRRLVLDAIDDRARSMALDELATVVATAEHTTADPPTETVERTAINLHHVHLPKMDDMDVLDYDPDQQRVTSGSEYPAI